MAAPGPGGRAGAVAEPAQEVPELQTVLSLAVEDGAGEKPARRRRKAGGEGRPSRRGRRGSGARAGTARCTGAPRRRRRVPAEAEDGPFIEDPLDDIGRG